MEGESKFKTRISYTNDQTFRDVFDLTRVTIKVGKNLAVAVMMRGIRESAVSLDAKLSEICDGAEVEKIVYWTFSKEDEDEI
jgi:hypothetical protein